LSFAFFTSLFCLRGCGCSVICAFLFVNLYMWSVRCIYRHKPLKP